MFDHEKKNCTDAVYEHLLSPQRVARVLAHERLYHGELEASEASERVSRLRARVGSSLSNLSSPLLPVTPNTSGSKLAVEK